MTTTGAGAEASDGTVWRFRKSIDFAWNSEMRPNLLKLLVLLSVVLSSCGGGGASTDSTTESFSVGGTASGLSVGTLVTLLNNGADQLTLNANGAFTFPTRVARSSSYTITVMSSGTGQTCTVTQGSGSGVTANVGNVRVDCTNANYSVGGSVSGLGAGKQVTLLINGGGPLTVAANGRFTFSTASAHNSEYAVTVGTQPTDQSCTVQAGSGRVSGVDVSGVQVVCGRACTTMLSGILSADATYEPSGSPYCISDSLQIPAGVAATFQPGTSIIGGGVVVRGTLSVSGTADSRVRMTDVSLYPVGTAETEHRISLVHADISGGDLHSTTGYVYGSFSLTDSRVIGTSRLYIWHPLGPVSIMRNVFQAAGGISYGGGVDNFSITIVNNYFADWTTGYAIENWAPAPARIEGNTFATTSRIAVQLAPLFANASMNAANNYWGSTDPAAIERMIFDRADDITFSEYVTYTPFLVAPALVTPLP